MTTYTEDFTLSQEAGGRFRKDDAIRRYNERLKTQLAFGEGLAPFLCPSPLFEA